MKTSRLSILLIAAAFAMTGCFGNRTPSKSEPASEPSSQTPSEPSSEQQPSENSSEEEPSEPSEQQPSENSSEEEPSEPSSEQQPSETSSEGQPSETSSEEEPSEPSSEDPSSEPSSESSTSVPDGDYIIKNPVEITIWTTFNDSYQSVINNVIEEFKKQEPNVTVNNVKQQGSYDDLKTMVINGTAVDNYPDIVAAYPDSVNDFILAGVGLDMEPYMLDDEIGWTEDDFDDIPEGYITAGQQYIIPGTYSLPATKSSEAMYYNQDKLIGLNLAPYDDTINGGNPLNDNYFKDLTWEEMFGHLIPALDAYDQAQDASHKLIDRDTFADWAWVGYDSDDNFFITLAEQYGYGYTSVDSITGQGHIEFNNEGMKNLMKTFKGYYDNHYFTTKGVIGTNVNYRSTVDAMLFSIGSTGGVKYQFADATAHNVGVAPIPHAEGRDNRIISQGPDFGFLDHYDEERSKATWLFYKLFSSTQFNTSWSLNTGYYPIRYSVMETEDYLDLCDFESKEEHTIDRLYALNFNYANVCSEYLFTSPVFKGSSEARNQVGTIFAACVSAGANLDSQIDSIFQTAKENTELKM